MKLHLTGTCVALCLALGTVSRAAPGAHHTPLTFAERVEYQLRLERIAHQHRVAQVPEPKPAFEQAMPETAVRAKVERYLKLSAALERYWQRPLTGEQLQAEMDRVARDTKQPRVLREMFAALDNDPYVIAECLARPLLAERLVRNWYAGDDRWHGELRRRAEAALAALPASDTTLDQLGGMYAEVTWRRGRDALSEGAIQRRSVDDGEILWLEDAEWPERTADIARAVGLPLGQALRAGERGALQESATDFSVTAVLEASQDAVRIAAVRWEKQGFDAWWSNTAPGLFAQPAPQAGELLLSGLVLPVTVQGDCTDDSWNPTRGDFPERRDSHTAVWTGIEMLVWGGIGNREGGLAESGFRYSPAVDEWSSMSTIGAPSPRSGHTAVWSPELQKMIVWGGRDATGTDLNTGGLLLANDGDLDANEYRRPLWERLPLRAAFIPQSGPGQR